MKVRAIKQGFYGDDLKAPGDVFEVKDGSKAKWFVPASDDDLETAVSGNARGGGSRRGNATKAGGGSGPSPQ
ncbi:hypothetical protein [Achromobacter insolitus]|uniref:hypothetical protein n=1 Tax=Achromobacter insolitus TaxID=217204 RepID=UPI0020A4FA64|nr:hypothetical protein [Achromobacter insolitus]MCP1404428.1 hypothetical protein [Achromobacter insolitus]